MDSQAKLRSSTVAGIVSAIIPIMLLLGLASLIWSSRQAGSSTLTEVGRVPKSVMWMCASGAVLPGSSDILLFGVDLKAKQLSGKQPGSLVLSLSHTGYRKLFVTATDVSYPNTPFRLSAGITPDGRNLLFSYRRRSAPLGLLSLADGRIIWKSKCWANIHNASRPFSGDGSMFLALRSDTPKRELWVFNTRSGKPIRRVSKPMSSDEGLDRYGFVSGTNRIIYTLWSRNTGTCLWSLDSIGDAPKMVTKFQPVILDISPNGRMLSFNQAPINKPYTKQMTPGFIGLLDNKGRDLRQLRVLAKDETASYPSWSPDSRYIAVSICISGRKIPFMKKADDLYQVEVYDTTTGSTVGRVRVPKQGVYVLEWYPDSKSLACISENDNEFIVYKLQVKQ